MGNRRSRPSDQGQKEQTFAGHLQQFISDEGKALSREGLEEVLLLLQTALATAIRTKERKVAWTCKVCLDNEIRILLKPCSHACLCTGCAPLMPNCPICRVPIQSRDYFILA